MESTKLIDEILSDYPRIWNFYKQNSGEKSRTPKFAQRYPLPIATLSLIVDFHKWVHESTKLVINVTGVKYKNQVRKIGVGPDPAIMSRLQWLSDNWTQIQQKNKIFARNLSNDIQNWHTRIRVKVNDGDSYVYETTMVCDACSHRSVIRLNDTYFCVNMACRNPLSGELRSWQV